MSDWPECKWAGDFSDLGIRSNAPDDRYRECRAAGYCALVPWRNCKACPAPPDQQRLARTESVVRLLTAALRHETRRDGGCGGICEECKWINCDTGDALTAVKELGLEEKTS